MRRGIILTLVAVIAILLPKEVRAVTPTIKEIDTAQNWVAQRFGPAAIAADNLPVSFIYGEHSSRKLLPRWKLSRETPRVDGLATRYALTLTDPASGLEMQVEATAYSDFPAVEWVAHFANTGKRDTPILCDLNAADLTLPGADIPEFAVFHAKGSAESATDFEPQRALLKPRCSREFAPYGGRSSDGLQGGMMPYFNISDQKTGGVIVAIGWTGQWRAHIGRDAGADLTVRTGMQDTHLRLYPGERIRTPATLVMFYNGDYLRGQNLWRRLMLAHYTPRPNGRAIDLPVAASGATLGFNNVSEQNQIQAATNIAAKHPPVGYYWIDAGWSTGGFPSGMGNWDPDAARFPRGLGPVGEAVHKLGMKFLLWFEPERVNPDTWLWKQHPEWLLEPSNVPTSVEWMAGWRLLNYGNSEALVWAKRTFSEMIAEYHVDIYRHDANIDPLFYWRTDEAWDRQGMNEIRYVTGLYDYFDALAREHPGLIIDNCASGGRRLDFEMMRRGVPLTPTDYLWEPNGAQNINYGLSLWLPLHGHGAVSLDPYDFRSGMDAACCFAFYYYDANASFWEPLRERIEEYRRVRPCFQGDFYPLTEYSPAADIWMAWQFDRPDLGEGMIQAFRRAAAAAATLHVNLQGLDPSAHYTVTNLDQPPAVDRSGADLMKSGLDLSIPTKPGAAIIVYKRK
jgi:alpha-galactosidase